MTWKASSGAAILPIDHASLRRWPLPEPDEAGDKNDRGRVLVIGGGRSVPGAIVLSAIAALRAGAGKLQLATVREAAIAKSQGEMQAIKTISKQGLTERFTSLIGTIGR